MLDIAVLARGIQDHPALPEVLPADARRAPGGALLLADGCYYIAYTPAFDAAFEGTLRVESRSGQLFASADLYRFVPGGRDPNALTVGVVPPPGPGIPIFPIGNYSHYLRVTQIEPAETGFLLVFEAHRFGKSIIMLDGNESPHWAREGAFTAQMLPAAAPPGHPRSDLFFVGGVSNDAGVTVGQLQIGWVSSILRKATVEIDRVPKAEIPLDNGADVSWSSIFASVGWDVTAVVSDGDVEKYDGPLWTTADAHAAMLARRSKTNLDAEWRYHILVVPLIDFTGGERGVMYDAGEGFNDVPREGLLVSSDYVFPPGEARWGPLRGIRAGKSTITFFRTAVHELGHAMGLGHREGDFSFMQTTDSIADHAPAERPFPINLNWSFAPDDQHRLRHWPDIIVRPGGVPFGKGSSSPLAGVRRPPTV